MYTYIYKYIYSLGEVGDIGILSHPKGVKPVPGPGMCVLMYLCVCVCVCVCMYVCMPACVYACTLCICYTY